MFERYQQLFKIYYIVILYGKIEQTFMLGSGRIHNCLFSYIGRAFYGLYNF